MAHPVIMNGQTAGHGEEVAPMELAIADLTDVDPRGVAIFGGKACGLARLLAAGSSVPLGFAVGITDRLPADWHPRDRDAFLDRAARLLRRGALAVRSSAAAEDGEKTSLAGQLVTVLSVSTPAAALDAAAACIASGRSERLLRTCGLESIPVGIVCQEQVVAACAGVCFTVDPTGQDGAVVIEAVAGTGAELLAGHVTPDRWRVHRSGRGDWEAIASTTERRSPLTAHQAADLAAKASLLANAWGMPLDLEWAIDSTGKLWWLQARPVTAGVAPPGPYRIDRACAGVDDGPISVWADWNLRESLPDPLPPLSWSVLRDHIGPALKKACGYSPSTPYFDHLLEFDRVSGRPYMNLSAVFAGCNNAGVLCHFLDLLDPQAGRITGDLIRRGILRPQRLPHAPLHRLRDVMGGLISGLGALARMVSPDGVLKRLQEFGDRLRKALSEDLSRLDDRSLLDELEGRLDVGCSLVHILMMVLGPALLAWARTSFQDAPDVARLLGTGNERVPTARIALGIDRLVELARPIADLFDAPVAGASLLETLRADPRAGEWLAEFSGFLERFGQRGPGELDISKPRWSEDPTLILDVVRAGIASRDTETATARMHRLRREKREAIGTAVGRFSPWRGLLLRVVSRWIDLTTPLREAPKHYALFGFAAIRQAVLEIGRRLAARGTLSSPEDIFFLEWTEIRPILQSGPAGDERDVREEIDRRKQIHADFLARRPPTVLRSDGVPVIDAAPAASSPDVLRGVPVSHGRVQGRVRILRSPDPRAISAGDVIVLRLADPGWTPLFVLAAGLVVEVGGVMCHAAVIAREMGIPAVFGVDGAARTLADGQRIELDGQAGTVRILAR